MSEKIDKAVEEFLARGGVIQQAAYRESGRVEGASTSPWGAKKAGRPAKTDEVSPEDDLGVEE
jgi:hypothetical protein